MEARWYCVSNIGLATLCNSQRDAETVAAESDRDWPKGWPHKAVPLGDVRALTAERDRLAAEVEALRADAGRWRYALTCVRIAQHGDFLVSPDDPTGIEHSIAGASFVREVDAAMKGKP